MWGDTIFPTGIPFSLVNNVWRYSIHGDTGFTMTPDLFVGEQGPADGRWICSQPFAPPPPPPHILRRHRTQTQSVLITRSGEKVFESVGDQWCVPGRLAGGGGLCWWVDLSRKFWSGENFGPGDQNSRKIGPPGPLFPENLGPAVE